jgi:hypothetical protein
MHDSSNPKTQDTAVRKGAPRASVNTISLEYNGKIVKARELLVQSKFPMSIDTAWKNVKTPALLSFVAKGMIRFKPAEKPLPKFWKAGETYGVKMRFFGFLPLGGTHFLSVEYIDEEGYRIETREWDALVKVWNHGIVLEDKGNNLTYYEDRIVIYGGILTGLITFFAKYFYIHRQKRWQIVAKEKITFWD